MSATTVDGLECDVYVESDGEVYRMRANGPSYFNGKGRFAFARVNTGNGVHGQIERDGRVVIIGFTAGLAAMAIADVEMWTAFGLGCGVPEFREIVAAVKE